LQQTENKVKKIRINVHLQESNRHSIFALIEKQWKWSTYFWYENIGNFV